MTCLHLPTIVWTLVLFSGTGLALPVWSMEQFGGKTAEQWRDVLADHVDGASDRDKDMCRQATSALACFGPGAAMAVAELTEALRSPSVEVRHAAVDALGRVGAEAAEAVPAIVGVMDLAPDHPHYAPLTTFRPIAARALGRIGPAAKAAVPALRRALDNHDPLYRVQAALALWRIGQDSEMIAFLAAMTGRSGAGAFEAVMALGETGSAAEMASDSLIAALNHPQADVRRAAAEVLARLGPSQIEAVAQSMEPGGADRDAPAAHALGRMLAALREDVFYAPGVEPARFNAAAGPALRNAAPALVALLSDQRDTVRHTAQDALSQMGLLAMPVVLDVLAGSDPLARRGAIETLVRLEDHLPPDGNRPQLAPVKNVLLNRLMDRMDHADPHVRSAAFRGFAALSFDAQSALPLLRRGLRDENLSVRRHAARALREWED